MPRARNLSQQWAKLSGLAPVALFASDENRPDGQHHAMLDGAHGSFVLSEFGDDPHPCPEAAGWAWSSDLPHHVAVAHGEVQITRWDCLEQSHWPLSAVEANFEGFYAALANDEVTSNQTVVQHMLNLFRRLRVLATRSHAGDTATPMCFLGLLEELIQRHSATSTLTVEARPVEHSTPAEPADPAEPAFWLRMLNESGVEALIDDALGAGYARPFNIWPSLAVRHAGGAIFQEVQSELLHWTRPTPSGCAKPARRRQTGRSGAHYTPSTLARSVAEQTIRRLADSRARERITVLDPSCGSGSMLNEALRALQWIGCDAEIVLVGRDTSATSTSMAWFLLAHAAADWRRVAPITLDIRTDDSLATSLPEADVVVMNPPFIPWTALDAHQRERAREALGTDFESHPDYSAAFVTRALEALRPGGALGTLLPASLLTSEAALRWRNTLLQRASPSVVAFLGDYQLLSHALVSVAAAVFTHRESERQTPNVTAVRVEPGTPNHAGDAMRALRTFTEGKETRGERGRWEVFEKPLDELASRPTWQLLSARTQRKLSALLEETLAPARELFEIYRGIHVPNARALARKINAGDTSTAGERTGIGPALLDESIRSAQICEEYWLCYPSDTERALPKREQSEHVPEPHSIQAPDAVTQDPSQPGVRAESPTTKNDLEGPPHTELPFWLDNKAPRLVCRNVGSPGSFALDIEARFIAIEGYAWFLNRDRADRPTILSLEDQLHGYLALLNSSLFFAVLDFFSPIAAPGQYSLEPTYVGEVPIPDFERLCEEQRSNAPAAFELAMLGRVPRTEEPWWVHAVDDLVAELYGPVIDDLVSRA